MGLSKLPREFPRNPILASLHPKTPADRQSSAGKFGTNGEILEIWGKMFGQHRAIH